MFGIVSVTGRGAFAKSLPPPVCIARAKVSSPHARTTTTDLRRRARLGVVEYDGGGTQSTARRLPDIQWSTWRRRICSSARTRLAKRKPTTYPVNGRACLPAHLRDDVTAEVYYLTTLSRGTAVLCTGTLMSGARECPSETEWKREHDRLRWLGSSGGSIGGGVRNSGSGSDCSGSSGSGGGGGGVIGRRTRVVCW